MVDHSKTDLLTDAENAVRAMLSPTGGMLPSSIREFRLQEFRRDVEPETNDANDKTTVAAMVAAEADDDEPFDVRIELGRARMPREEARRLRSGAVVRLDGRMDEPVAIRAGGRLIGRGDAVVIDGKIGVRVIELFQEEAAS